MSTLLVNPLSTTLEQEFTLDNNYRYDIGSFAPYLYVHNAPSGTFTFELIQGVTTLQTWSFSSEDIKISLSTANNFLHVFYPLTKPYPYQLKRGTFKLKLSATGYSNTISSFIGWIQQHENLNNELSYTPFNDEENPLAIRLKVYKEGINA